MSNDCEVFNERMTFTLDGTNIVFATEQCVSVCLNALGIENERVTNDDIEAKSTTHHIPHRHYDCN